MKKDAVTISGTEKGTIIGINDEQNFTKLKSTLKEQFAISEKLLNESIKIIIDVGTRNLSSKEKKEVTRLVRKYSGSSLKRLTWRQSTASGQVISINSREEIDLKKDKEKDTAAIVEEISIHAVEATVELNDQSSRAESLQEDEAGEDETILIKRTLRSGQSIHFDGNVVILGDVNPGAEVVASGNIVVMGSLRGVAHAGAMGNENAIVTAFRLQPMQLRIANHITRAPDGELPYPEQPEMARIKDGVVIIEAYQTNQEKQMKIG